MEDEIVAQLLDWVRIKKFGKYRGIVKDSVDTSYRGRIKVQIPSVLDEMEVWAMPCVLYTGKDVGTYLIPEEGAGVWVEFEAGDVSYPIWSGGFWAEDELPADNKKRSGIPTIKTIRSRTGLMISLDDDRQEINVSDENGENVVNIEINSGKITVKGALKVVVEAPQIELVENATHPVVLGDNLLQYLNQLVQLYQSHTHPGETIFGFVPVTPAIPVPGFPSATPSLVSKKVKSG